MQYQTNTPTREKQLERQRLNAARARKAYLRRVKADRWRKACPK